MRMIICLAGGIVWGLLFTAAMTLAGFPMGEGSALVAGLVFGLVGYPLLWWQNEKRERRIHAALEHLPSPAEVAFDGLMQVGKKRRNVTFCLCAAELCWFDPEQREIEIHAYPAREIVRANVLERNQVQIHLTEGHVLVFRTNAAVALLSALRQRDWLPLQKG